MSYKMALAVVTSLALASQALAQQNISRGSPFWGCEEGYQMCVAADRRMKASRRGGDPKMAGDCLVTKTRCIASMRLCLAGRTHIAGYAYPYGSAYVRLQAGRSWVVGAVRRP